MECFSSGDEIVENVLLVGEASSMMPVFAVLSVITPVLILLYITELHIIYMCRYVWIMDMSAKHDFGYDMRMAGYFQKIL